MDIEIVTGTAADRLLADASFERGWQALHAACPWSTVLQTAPFARAWYTTYRPDFEPVLVLGHGNDRSLVGLLAAGYSARRGLVMAGAQQAEYQTWLATPDRGDTFAASAFYALARQFPSSALTLKYLPPGTPLGWVNGDSPVARYCVLSATSRPLMDLRDRDAIDRCLKKRNIRSRLNKLKDDGYAGIERITDPDHLARYFDEIIAWHDFRRVTVSGVGPFENDPLKKTFHFEMLRQGVLCATVLKLRNRVVSMQLDMIGQKGVHLALGAYAPWLSKFALGKIHILEVAAMLRDEGIDWIDLTPGDDPYKSEFATQWEDVHTLTVSPSAGSHQKARLMRQVDRVARRALQQVGSNPVAAKIAARNLYRRPLATLVRPVQQLVRRWTTPASEMIAYARTAWRLLEKPEADAGQEVHFDSVADWLAYRPAGLEPPRHDCLLDATRRFAEGMQSYTVVKNGRLRFSCWLAGEPTAALAAHGLENLKFAGPAAVLLDIRTYGGDPASVLAQALSQVARDVVSRQKVDTVVVLVDSNDRPTLKAIENVGFKHRQIDPDPQTDAASSVAAAFNGWVGLTAALHAAGIG